MSATTEILDSTNTLSYQVIRDESQRNSVMDLVSKVYTKTGYINPERKVDLSTHTYLNRDDAITVIATPCGQEESIGTISIMTDKKGLLEIDVVYGEELSELRKTGNSLAEVRRFAIDDESVKTLNDNSQGSINELQVSMTLLGIAVRYAQFNECDLICFMIKKEHKAFYESLGCVAIGGERPCPAIDNKPVVAYKLDVRNIDQSLETNKSFLLKGILDVSLPSGFFA